MTGIPDSYQHLKQTLMSQIRQEYTLPLLVNILLKDLSADNMIVYTKNSRLFSDLLFKLKRNFRRVDEYKIKKRKQLSIAINKQLENEIEKYTILCSSKV